MQELTADTKTNSLLIHDSKDIFRANTSLSGTFAPKQMIISQSHIETLNCLQSLKGLCIDKSIFTTDICELVNLEMLTLNNISEHERFECLGKMQSLKKLRYLNLARNELETLPEWISKLPLKSLIISNNRLKELPSNLPSTLITLDFSVNLIKRLPESLSFLKRMRYINWESNPIQFPPKAILSNGIESTMNYLKQFLREDVPNEKIKLLFVGRKRAGKTTLMHALKSSNGKASDLKKITKTNGVDIEVNKMQDVKFNMFDLAGDDNYLETHSMFLSDDALYLAVFNVQLYEIYSKRHDVLTRIETWLSLIYSRTENARVIIVATHVDTSIAYEKFLEDIWSKLNKILLNSKKNHPLDFDENCLICHNGDLTREKEGKVVVNAATDSKSIADDCCEEAPCFPHVVGYFEVSSVKNIPRKPFGFQNRSICQLKEHIVNVAREMLSKKPVISRRWVCFKDILERSYTENEIISYSAILQKWKGVSMSEDDLLPFLKYYTSKGDLIYFDRPNKDEAFIILDSQWLSKQLRQVITYKDIPEIKGGIISHDYVNHVFGKENSKQILHLFRYTSTFIPFNENNELIPFLLPIGKPTDSAWPLAHKKNQVDFVFQFSFLPPEYFSHIMADIHQRYSRFPLGDMKPIYYYNNIVFNTTYFQEKCEFHENLSNIEQTKLNHRVRFELLPHLDQIVLSVMGKYPCCMAVNLQSLVTKHRESLCQNVKIQTKQLCVECVEKRVQEPSTFDIPTVESSGLVPICKIGHDLQSWHDLRMGKCESRDTATRSQIEKIYYSNDKECPKLFLILPVNTRSLGMKDLFITKFGREGYAVHLLCECPGAWHFLSAPGYFLRKPRPFIEKYGPRMQALLKVISKGIDILNPILSSPAIYATEILNKVVELLHNFLDKTKHDNKFIENLSYATSIEYLKCNKNLNKKELQFFLNTADSEGRFGDLIVTLVGDQLLWLCEKHARYWQQLVLFEE